MGADYTSLPLEEIRASDAIKVVMAKAKGISLIVVPCWWDGQASRFIPYLDSHTCLQIFMQFDGNYSHRSARLVDARKYRQG